MAGKQTWIYGEDEPYLSEVTLCGNRVSDLRNEVAKLYKCEASQLEISKKSSKDKKLVLSNEGVLPDSNQFDPFIIKVLPKIDSPQGSSLFIYI
jgi:hypothetical protein